MDHAKGSCAKLVLVDDSLDEVSLAKDHCGLLRGDRVTSIPGTHGNTGARGEVELGLALGQVEHDGRDELLATPEGLGLHDTGGHGEDLGARVGQGAKEELLVVFSREERAAHGHEHACDDVVLDEALSIDTW